MTDAQFWLNNGIAVTVLAAVGFAVWRIIIWAGRKLDPIMKAHLDLIQTLREHSPKQTTKLEQVLQENVKQTQAILNQKEALEDHQHHLDGLLAEIVETQKVIVKALNGNSNDQAAPP